MKKNLAFLFVVLCSHLLAQKEIRYTDGSYFRQCAHFEISKPLWQLSKDHPSVEKTGAHHEAADAKRKFPWMSSPSTNIIAEDPVVQKIQGNVSANGTIQNFDGQGSSNGWDPLDPTGMAGLNH